MALLLLAGCANTNVNGVAGSLPRPKTAIVADFKLSSDVVVIDRGYTARLQRKLPTMPVGERGQRTVDRVNDEIVATIVATMREAGLDAQPGSEEGLSLSDNVLMIGGRLRPLDEGNSKRRNAVGFGTGRGGVVADMSATYFSWGGKREVLKFTAAPPSGRSPAVPPKIVAARNAEINKALASEGAAAEKLSGDVEAQARRIGREAGERVVAFAKEQGWMQAAASAAAPGEETRVNLPEANPARKLAQKPADAQDDPDEPEESKS